MSAENPAPPATPAVVANNEDSDMSVEDAVGVLGDLAAGRPASNGIAANANPDSIDVDPELLEEGGEVQGGSDQLQTQAGEDAPAAVNADSEMDGQQEQESAGLASDVGTIAAGTESAESQEAQNQMQSSLDSLLGSLASGAESAPTSNDAEEAAPAQSMEAVASEMSEDAQPQQSQSQSQPPFDDIAAALASAPTTNVDVDRDAVPGLDLPATEPAHPSSVAPPGVSSLPGSATPQPQHGQQQQPTNSFSPYQAASQEQPTPGGSPFPGGQAQQQAPPPASLVQAVAPSINSFTPTGTPTKTTPLATDPTIARQTAQQLLDRKPQTLSRLAKLRHRIEKDCFDGQAWLELIQDAVQKGDLERTREVYNGFLKNFPDNAKEWIAFADLELSHGNNDRVNEIFGRCLRGSPSVALWQFYLTYIRRTNPIDRSSPERALPARDVVTKAFEFSLAHVGADIEAGSIWYDYIEFLKEGEVAGTWEAQQKMDKLRQTYQRAVCIPLHNIEHIWRDYDAFENNLNRATAKKFLQDRSPAYMTARATSRQIQSFVDRFPKDPVPHRPDWESNTDRGYIQSWKSLLQYEESDPMELGDQAAIRTRVMLAYKKAIAQLRFYPEIWYMAAGYARKSEKPDEATTFYRSGMEANPTSLLLHYAFIESEEGKGNFDVCHKVYNAIIERLQVEIEGVTSTTQTEINEALEEKARLEAQEKQMKTDNMGDDEYIGEDVRMQERENIKKAITDSKAEHLEELKRLGANVWIMQMRFARRAEGIQAARSVFSKARKWAFVTWQVFEASAMLELHWNKEQKIATNVFEVGLKRFNDEVGFVVRYLDFLLAVNDDGNARAVFERSIAKISAEKAKPLWRRWADHEYLFGDLTAIQKLDARLAEAYPDDPPIDRFTERHTYLDLDDIAYRDLGREDEDRSRSDKRDLASPTPPPQQQPQMQMQQQQPPPMMQQNQMQMLMPLPPQQAAMPGMAPNMPTPLSANAVANAYNRPGDYPPFQGPPSIDGDDRRRSSGRGPPMQNKRRRSPSPPARRGRRPNSPPRVSRHTPPDDFPEAIPWLMSQLPSKTVFSAHGPILDWQHLLHLLMTTNIAPSGGEQGYRGRDRSISPRRRNGGGGRRRSPDYALRRR